MLTIKKISSNGFFTEQGWKKVDRFKVASKPLFLNLKVGDRIDNVKYNKENYIIGYDIVDVPKSIGVDVLERDGGTVNLPPTSHIYKTNSRESPSSVQDNIRYAQCVNIAFANYRDVNLKFQDQMFIKEAFDVADLIYAEFNRRVLLGPRHNDQ